MTFKEILNKIEDFIYSSGWRIVAFFAILFFGIIIVRYTHRLLKKIFTRGPLNKTLGGFLASVVKFFLYLLLLFVLAGVAGIDLQPLTTLLLSAGLAVSLALQDSLSNVANGMIIVATKPFTVGDFIEVAGVMGTVRKIGMISTELITPDNRKITVPNTKIMGDNVINISARPTRRVDLVFMVSRDSDLKRVKDTLYASLKAHPKTLDEPEPTVKMSGHTENAFQYNARAWVKTPDYWDVYWELTEQIAIDFKKNGIKIPYKKLDISLDNSGGYVGGGYVGGGSDGRFADIKNREGRGEGDPDNVRRSKDSPAGHNEDDTNNARHSKGNSAENNAEDNEL